MRDETPLRFNTRLQRDDPLARVVLSTLGPLKDGALELVSTVIANFKMDPTSTLFYSRDRSYYSKPSSKRYFPKHVTYSAMIEGVDALVQCGLIEDLRTPPSPRAKHRSRTRASELLQLLLNEVHPCPVEYIENEPIVLRRSGESKEQIDYVDTESTRAMRADVQAQNAFLCPVTIGLEGMAGSIVDVGGKRYDLSSKLLYRVFNGDFEHGGRWYGPAWQSLPKKMRMRLTIDGSATWEEDFSACHAQLLCATAGLALPFDDPDFYRLDGFEREEIKYAFQIILNSNSLISARGALIEKLQELGIPDAPRRAQGLSKALPAAWPQLRRHWFTGIGLRLQRIDADVCARVQADMRAQGIPVLSVHDSFIVPIAARQLLVEVMKRAMTEACARLHAHPLDIEQRKRPLKRRV